MSFEELHAAARRQPFTPFRLTLTTGDTYDIRHPDMIMVGRRTVAIGISRRAGATTNDLIMQIDLLHIVAIEALPASTTQTTP